MDLAHLPPAAWVDLVIGVTLLEGAALAAWHRRHGSGVAPREFVLNMASGLCLMGALRCLAAGAGSVWLAAFLLAAGACHAADMARRWTSRRAAAATPSDAPRAARP